MKEDSHAYQTISVCAADRHSIPRQCNQYLTTTEVLKYRTIYSEPYKKCISPSRLVYSLSPCQTMKTISRRVARKRPLGLLSIVGLPTSMHSYASSQRLIFQLNIFFSVGAFIVFVLDFLLQDIYVLPAFVFYFSACCCLLLPDSLSSPSASFIRLISSSRSMSTLTAAPT